MGEEAYDAALSTTSGAALIGVVGAGTGAAAGGLKGAVGSASVVLADGTTVAALVVVNAFGSCVYPLTGELYAARFGLPGECTELLLPDADEVAAARAAADTVAVPGRARHAFATTIGVVATDANLTKAQCAKVSGVAHDGMARAIRPVHTMFDGDTVFTHGDGGPRRARSVGMPRVAGCSRRLLHPRDRQGDAGGRERPDPGRSVAVLPGRLPFSLPFSLPDCVSDGVTVRAAVPLSDRVSDPVRPCAPDSDTSRASTHSGAGAPLEPDAAAESAWNGSVTTVRERALPPGRGLLWLTAYAPTCRTSPAA